ncbi:MAG TPA: HEAT repeat domain-containing protein [Nitrospirota bacterium]
MRNLVSAIRAVKLYPPNNPVYSQAVKKSYESFEHFLASAPLYLMGVQKTFFTYEQTPLGKDAQLNKPIAQDLFTKGIRQVEFNSGVEAEELLSFYEAIALSPEELSIRGGISSILWEKGATHIKVTEAGLDNVILLKGEKSGDYKAAASTPPPSLDPATAKKEITFCGRTLVLGDLMADPAGFGAGMLQLANETRAEHESVEDRLATLYREAGRKVREEPREQSNALFDGLAQSALNLNSPYREGFIAGRLYRELDEETAREYGSELQEQVPHELHEIMTGRYAGSWTVEQVAALLKKTAAREPAPARPSPPAGIAAAPLPQDLAEIAETMSKYTPDEMAVLQAVSESGMESDIISAAMRILISLLPLVENPHRPAPSAEQEAAFFSSIIRQLEDMYSYLLQKKDYALATMIIKAFQTPVGPLFKPRLAEALKKTTSRPAIIAAISDLRKRPKGSPEYQSIYAYLAAKERDVTEILLELLAEENDRSFRLFLLELAKDLGKNQVMLFGERISDDRWYFVRNIVAILADSKADQAVAFLQRAAEHKNIRIRQEVVKGLLTIGGKRAASVLAKFLKDKDADIQLMAIRGLADISGAGREEEKSLVEFLQDRQLKKKEQEFANETIKSLGKIGGPAAREFLKRYDRIRWWKPRKLQAELRAAAQHAREEIRRRQGDGGRTKR